MHQAVLPSTHTSLTGVSIPILTPMSLWYLAGCFPLAFLKGQWSLLSSGKTFLYLNLSVPSKRVVSSTSTSFQSCWRYSNAFFFFFSSRLSLSLWPPLSFLPSELHVQLNMTLPLLPTGPGATVSPHIFAASLTIAFQAP